MNAPYFDKFCHVLFWYAGALTLAVLFGITVSFWFMFGAAFLKELSDAYFDPFDLTASIFGLILGLAFYNLFILRNPITVILR